jgi:IPT/TIG domain
VTSVQRFLVTPVVFSVSPTSGPVGTAAVMTGDSLTGDSKVTLGGVKATVFAVNSYTQITATVPTGAKTGKIQVTTSGGIATSPGTFTVN